MNKSSYNVSDFEIKPALANGFLYYEIYYKGSLWGTADTVSEANHDIRDAVGMTGYGLLMKYKSEVL